MERSDIGAGKYPCSRHEHSAPKEQGYCLPFAQSLSISCKGHEVQNLTMNSVVKPVRATGSIGVVGVFVVEDPAPEDTLMQKGQLAFDFCTSGKEKKSG